MWFRYRFNCGESGYIYTQIVKRNIKFAVTIWALYTVFVLTVCVLAVFLICILLDVVRVLYSIPWHWPCSIMPSMNSSRVVTARLASCPIYYINAQVLFRALIPAHNIVVICIFRHYVVKWRGDHGQRDKTLKAIWHIKARV